QAMLSNQLEQARLQVEAADLAYRSGVGPQSDVFATRAAVAEIEDRIAAAERDVAIATTRRARWVGDAAARPLGDPPTTATVPLELADLESQVAHHPQIAVLLEQEEIAMAEVEIARTEKRADWTVEVMYSQRGSAFSDMVSLNFS